MTWGDANALPSNRICAALGAKLRAMILDIANPTPDGKAAPFHVYINLPVHSEGALNDPAIIGQIHNTMQTLVYGSHSLVNQIRRSIKARQLFDKKDAGWKRAFDNGNTEFTSVPVAHCWAYLTLLNLRNWGELGQGEDKRLVTEQIYVHTKLMVVDDRFAIVGSANINDRSLLGNRDSELAVLVMDTNFSYEDIGSPDGDAVVRGFARDLRMQVWRKIFGAAAGELADAIKRPAAPSSRKTIQDRAAKNTAAYEAAFSYIPANGKIIWPNVKFDGGKRIAGQLLPFDTAFWGAPQHSPAAAQELQNVKGFITLLPYAWTLGENNKSNMHPALLSGLTPKLAPVPGVVSTDEGTQSASAANTEKAKA